MINNIRKLIGEKISKKEITIKSYAFPEFLSHVLYLDYLFSDLMKIVYDKKAELKNVHKAMIKSHPDVIPNYTRKVGEYKSRIDYIYHQNLSFFFQRNYYNKNSCIFSK